LPVFLNCCCDTLCSYTAAALDEVNPKRKILERLFPDLTTNAGEQRLLSRGRFPGGLLFALL
jgi:hypothetical protein